MATQIISTYHAALDSVSTLADDDRLLVSTAAGEDKAVTAKTLLAQSGDAINAVQKQVTANATSITSLEEADTELKKLLRGTSDDSSARTEPFFFLGTYDDDADGSTTGLSKFLAALDALDYSQPKYAGQLRAYVNGVNVWMTNFVRSFASKAVTQVIEGALQMKDGAITAYAASTYNRFFRIIEGTEFGLWQELVPTAVTTNATAIAANAKSIAANAASITSLQTDLASLTAAVESHHESVIYVMTIAEVPCLVDNVITTIPARKRTALRPKKVFSTRGAGGDSTASKFITSVDASRWDVSGVTNLGQVFAGCTALTAIDVSTWDTTACTNLYGTFTSCSALTSVDVGGWDTANVTHMGLCFRLCSALTTLNLTAWDASMVTSTSGMFAACTALTTIVGPYTLSEVTTNGIKALAGLSVSIGFGSSKNLNTASAVAVMNGLATVSTAQTLTFAKEVYTQLTDEQLQIATNKGWTVVAGWQT